MKKVVPFTKTLTFKTMIAEITDIEIKHTLELKSIDQIEGDILVDGKYKMTDASILEEEFHYQLPFVIAIDSRYDAKDVEINIGNFNFEIINEEDLKVNVDIVLDNLIDFEETREDIETIPVEIEETKEKVIYEEEPPIEKLNKELDEEIEIESTTQETKKESNTNIGSIFSSITSNEETFSTYHVYIVRESDTIDSILDKYKINREELSNYNDLDDVKVGSKLIIPCAND